MQPKKKEASYVFLLCLILIGLQSFGIPFVFGNPSTQNNFYLIVTSGSAITIYHKDVAFSTHNFSVTLSVQSGFLNSTNANLIMYDTAGILQFTSINITNILVSGTKDGLYIGINGKQRNAYAISESETVSIEWSTVGWNPVFLICGLIGLTIFFVTPTYTIYQVKRKKNYVWLFYCLLFFAIGYGFVSVWLT